MTNDQGPKNPQAPASKTYESHRRRVGRSPWESHWSLGIEAWNFFGNWSLGVGHYPRIRNVEPETPAMTSTAKIIPAVRPYRGRLAPSPTGLLHLGHARTFWTAQQRAQRFGGALVLRNEDLDRARCKPEFVDAMTEDLRWF